MTLIEKIQRHITPDGDCWQWHGCMQGAIPMMKHDGKVANVRRLVLIERGVPMKGHIATYTCGNPVCVNPEHAARSTRTQMNRRNMAEMSGATNTLRFIVEREIYSHLEKVVDRFEDVANEIDGLVIDHA